ncbi:MAG: type 1 glutamine amidotransferase [Methanospirillum sp.]
MKVAVLLHDPAEPAGLIDELLAATGHSAATVRLDETNEVPGGLDGAALVLMGGPMSANDEALHPWLAAEKALVRRAVGAGRPVLGICLGAQVIASALGARVYPSEQEVGWRALAGVPGYSLLPPAFPAFELHGETFDLPAGAVLLATGERVPHQAFAVGSAVGLQFHLEATAPMIAAWAADLPEMERERCAAETERFARDAHRLCGAVRDYVLRR